MAPSSSKRKGKKVLKRPVSASELVQGSNWKSLEHELGRTGKKRKVGKEKKSGGEQKDEDIWFDIDDEDLERDGSGNTSSKRNHEGIKSQTVLKSITDETQLITGPNKEKTKYVALDCEMVGTGREGKYSILARVSIVNKYGHVLYDSYVKPKERVSDYRTFVSGIRPANLKNAASLETVLETVSDLLKGRILVGHALKNDFRVLLLNHPKRDIRDSSRYKPFRKYAGGRTPGLKKLCEKLLGLKIQEGAHSSIIDAQATMMLYNKFAKEWDQRIKAPLRPEGAPKKKPMRQGDRRQKRSKSKADSEHGSKNLFNNSTKK